MFMKTKDEAEEVEELKSRGVEGLSAEGKRRHKLPDTG
jgi:hypothetical protein